MTITKEKSTGLSDRNSIPSCDYHVKRNNNMSFPRHSSSYGFGGGFGGYGGGFGGFGGGFGGYGGGFGGYGGGFSSGYGGYNRYK